VNEILKIYSLPIVSQDDWDRIYNGIISLRVPKKIKDYWLKKSLNQPNDYASILKNCLLDLDDAHKNSDIFKLSFNILDNEESYKIAKAMIIKKLPNEDISALLNGKLSIGVNFQAVTLFEKYFFNVRNFTRKDWKKYFSSLSDAHDQKFLIDCFQNNLDDLKIENNKIYRSDNGVLTPLDYDGIGYQSEYYRYYLIEEFLLQVQFIISLTYFVRIKYLGFHFNIKVLLLAI
jgi:hypothetical protein